MRWSLPRRHNVVTIVPIAKTLINKSAIQVAEPVQKGIVT